METKRTGVNLVVKVLFILESFQHFYLNSGCSSATPQRLLQIELSLNRLLTHAGILLVMSVMQMLNVSIHFGMKDLTKK